MNRFWFFVSNVFVAYAMQFYSGNDGLREVKLSDMFKGAVIGAMTADPKFANIGVLIVAFEVGQALTPPLTKGCCVLCAVLLALTTPPPKPWHLCYRCGWALGGHCHACVRGVNAGTSYCCRSLTRCGFMCLRLYVQAEVNPKTAFASKQIAPGTRVGQIVCLSPKGDPISELHRVTKGVCARPPSPPPPNAPTHTPPIYKCACVCVRVGASV